MSLELESESTATPESGMERPESNVEDYRDLERQVKEEYAARAAFELEGTRTSDFRAILEAFPHHIDMFVKEMEAKLKNAKNRYLH